MDFSLHQLRAFEEVAKNRNISKAAVSLGLSQPALSWLIRKMEDQLGVQLFVRTKKGVSLTKAGDTFLSRSRELSICWERLNLAIQKDERDASGLYTLGAYHTVAMYALPQFFPQLSRRYPKIELRLVDGLSREITEGVINLQIDFGLVVNPVRHPDLTIVELYKDELLFWVRKEPSPLQDFRNSEAVFCCNPEMLQWDSMLKEASSMGWLRGHRVLYATDLMVIAALVREGGAIGLLPRTIAESFAGEQIQPLPRSPRYGDIICLVWRGDAQKTHAAQLIRQSIVAGLRTDEEGSS